MSEMLTKTHVGVDHEEDRVLLQIGNAIATFPYMSAHRIAMRLQLEAKAAMAQSNEPVGNWRDIGAQHDRGIGERKIGPGAAHSKPQRQVGVYAVGPLVVLNLAGVEFRMEFETALTIADWLRTHATQAGAWAGDPGGALLIMGRLHNATPTVQ